MLFQRRFLAGIRDGSITLTFRAWKSARVRVGGSYRLGPDDAVLVRAVDHVPLSAITASEVRKAGFASRDELVLALRRTADRRLTSRSRVYRIGFRCVRAADPRPARGRDASVGALEEVAARLANMDRKSRRGPWTLDVLRLLERNPRVAAAVLAPRMERETRVFKADVRKLRELGLTESHEVGYSLTPRGRAVLERAGRRR